MKSLIQAIMEIRLFSLAIFISAAVIGAAVYKGGCDNAYMGGYADGVDATVKVLSKIEKPKPEIKIDTVYVDTVTGKYKI